jgi:hypothetical protein
MTKKLISKKEYKRLKDNEETRTLKCASCGEVIKDVCDKYSEYKNYLEEYGDYPENYKSEKICPVCEHDDLLEPIGTIVRYDCKNLQEVTKFGHYLIQYGGCGIVKLDDKCLDDFVREYIKNCVWKSTDGWRGYYRSKVGGEWVKVLDTWFGSIDGYFHGDSHLEKFHKLLEFDENLPDFELYVCYPRTSNVCSCCIEVYVRKDDIEQYKDWIGRDIVLEGVK